MSKAIDKAAGAEREAVGPSARHKGRGGDKYDGPDRYPLEDVLTAPATREAEQWQGWGTALAPSHEPVVVARKPLSGTVAENVQRFGTGAINVDATRVSHSEPIRELAAQSSEQPTFRQGGRYEPTTELKPEGRWPKNTVLVHDSRCRQTGTKKVRRNIIENAGGSGDSEIYSDGKYGSRLVETRDETVAAWECVPECMVGRLDGQAGERPGFSGGGTKGAGFRAEYVGGERADSELPAQTFGDSGSCSRFFPQFQAERARYVAKAGRRERNAGLGEFEEKERRAYDGQFREKMSDPRMNRPQQRLPQRNIHPTCKPVALMRWIVRLVTRPGGTVLDPFAGSGSTGIACVLEGFDFVGIEKQGPEYVKANPDTDDYVSIMRARIAHAETHPWDYDPDIPEPKKGDEPLPGQTELF